MGLLRFLLAGSPFTVILPAWILSTESLVYLIVPFILRRNVVLIDALALHHHGPAPTRPGDQCELIGVALPALVDFSRRRGWDIPPGELSVGR